MLLLFVFGFRKINKEYSYCSNIFVTNSLVENKISEFVQYCKDKKGLNIENQEHFISVSVYENKDSSKNFVLELWDFGMGEKYLKNDFFGYAMQSNLYIVFWNNCDFYVKNSSIKNPSLFNKNVTNDKIKNVYHPFYWEFVIKNHGIIKTFQ
jgi:hypothetical protein